MRTSIIGAALALTITTAVAQTSVWEDDASAGFVLPGCKAALTNQINRPLTDQVDGSFLVGMCLGYIRAIGMFTATPGGSRLCTDFPGVTSEEMVRVVIGYIEARPQSVNLPFIWLATDALINAWPCPK